MYGITDGRLQRILRSIFSPVGKCIGDAVGRGGTTEGFSSGYRTLLGNSSDTYASAVLQFTGQPVDGQRTGIYSGSHGKVYKFVDGPGMLANDILIGATLAETASNYKGAIVADPAEAGVTHGVGTTISAVVRPAITTVGPNNTVIVYNFASGSTNRQMHSIEGLNSNLQGVFFTGGEAIYDFGAKQASGTFSVYQGSDRAEIFDGVQVTIDGVTYTFTAYALPNEPNYITIEHTGFATGTWFAFGVPADGDTVTIGDRVYTLETVFSDTPDYVLIGGSANSVMMNMAAAINRDAGEGVVYGTGTVAHPDATGFWSGVFLSVFATVLPGVEGQIINTSSTSGVAVWIGGARLNGSQNTLVTVRNNLVDAINGTGTPGVQYSVGTVAHPTVTASPDGASRPVMHITAKASGIAGNSISTTSNIEGSVPYAIDNLLESFGMQAPTLTGGEEAKDIREIELITDTATWIQVDIVKRDGSTISETIEAPSEWKYTSAMNESPISTVTLTNLTAADTNFVFNAVTRK